MLDYCVFDGLSITKILYNIMVVPSCLLLFILWEWLNEAFLLLYLSVTVVDLPISSLGIHFSLFEPSS